MPRLHLTDITVRSLKPTKSYVSYWDDTTPGFGIRVGLRSKTWTVMRGRSRERLTIGRYGDLSLAEARIEAKKLLSATPEPKTQAIPFATARDQFLTEHYASKKARTKAEAERLLTKHFAGVSKMVLPDIEDTDVKLALDKLASTPSEQLHAYRAVRCFLRWCTRPPRRYIRHSPMEGYEPPSTDRKGTRVLSDDELKAVWKAAGAPPHAVIRLLILWGTRNTETILAERSWAGNRDVLTIPGEHTKNGRDHSIPICPLAQATLDLFPSGGTHFFHSRWGDGHLSFSGLAKAKREVMKASGTTGWQTRDLRRTFRSNMARLKVPREVCEVLINHAPPVLDEIYDRYDRIDEKRDALAKYEHFIQALVARE